MKHVGETVSKGRGVQRMRKKIIETIKAVGLNIDDFIIGSGARDAFSEIHYRRMITDQTGIHEKTIPYSFVKTSLQFGKLENELINVQASI